MRIWLHLNLSRITQKLAHALFLNISLLHGLLVSNTHVFMQKCRCSRMFCGWYYLILFFSNMKTTECNRQNTNLNEEETNSRKTNSNTETTTNNWIFRVILLVSVSKSRTETRNCHLALKQNNMYEKNESQKNDESQFDADHISSTRSMSFWPWNWISPCITHHAKFWTILQCVPNRVAKHKNCGGYVRF